MALNCTNNTVSYSHDSKGWPSFYSYIPDYMIGMNSFFYSFSDGNLFRHNTNNIRNRFYNVNYKSTITSVFNPEPTLSIKLFKTMSYEANTTSLDTLQARWACTSLFTDLTDGNPGSMLATYFVQKEGEFFSFIRNNGQVNWAMRAATGIGNCNSVDAADTLAVLIGFPLNLGVVIGIGDDVYRVILNGSVSTGPPELIGRITARTSTQLTVDVQTYNGQIPNVNQYITAIKNGIAESHGARGYFLQFTLENNSTQPVELFSVGGSLMKSYP